jgi:hypothetical protein
MCCHSEKPASSLVFQSRLLNRATILTLVEGVEGCLQRVAQEHYLGFY